MSNNDLKPDLALLAGFFLVVLGINLVYHVEQPPIGTGDLVALDCVVETHDSVGTSEVKELSMRCHHQEVPE